MLRRFLGSALQEALEDTRVVFINGPRQSGKTTLAKTLATPQRPFISLDDPTHLIAARDTTSFIRQFDYVVIDEVQRVPELLLAIKQSVDADPRPGRFLLTGSANILLIPQIADPLAGRIELLTLYPFAQAELLERKSSFLPNIFKGKKPLLVGECSVGDDLVAQVCAGGYPEAVRRKSTRRTAWLMNYIETILARDVQDIAKIQQLTLLPRLMQALSLHTGQLLNYSTLAAPLQTNHNTLHRYIDILRSLFVVYLLPSFGTRELSRLVKAPKMHLVDSGLVAALRGLTVDRLRLDRKAFGGLLETFVLTELLKLASGYFERIAFSHFRDKDGLEVDIVLENSRGQIVALEVKAAASVTQHDFKGLRRLQKSHPERFVFGAVLYDHDQIAAVGENLWALPISCLWS